MQVLTTNRKALNINLDPNEYGTFAEIGAGQEVARHFFKAGGAAGTIAKSMSAYDMKFSDDIYGKCKRYVSRDRLLQMLDHEYELLTERLDELRGDRTCFFAYANTVAARNYKGTNECHGWMGVRFQTNPRTPPNDIIVHVRMLDKTNQLQQDALGIFGVNLIYGSFYTHNNPDIFIQSLEDNIGPDRIEVDMIEFNGPAFEEVDNRVLSLKLVEFGLTKAVMFAPQKVVLQPSEALYKKCVLLERGSFRPVTYLHLDMLRCAGSQFLQEPGVLDEEVVILMEITMHSLQATGEIDYDDFLARVDTLSILGYNVLISNYFEFYRLIAYVRRYTTKMVGMALGINTLLEVFNDAHYKNLEGGILEASGRLFKENTKLYVYPMKGIGLQHYAHLVEQMKAEENIEGIESEPKPVAPISELVSTQFASEMLVTAQNVQVKLNLRSLYAYLLENHYIESIVGYDPKCLDMFSRDILAKMRNGDESWTALVPKEVVEMIKEKGLFGYSKLLKSNS